MSKEETSSARDVAEVAEEAARMAIERAQAVESRLGNFSTVRHLESEPVQSIDEDGDSQRH